MFWFWSTLTRIPLQWKAEGGRWWTPRPPYCPAPRESRSPPLDRRLLETTRRDDRREHTYLLFAPSGLSLQHQCLRLETISISISIRSSTKNWNSIAHIVFEKMVGKSILPFEMHGITKRYQPAPLTEGLIN